ALLLADGRVRPSQGVGGGARRRLPAGRARRGLGGLGETVAVPQGRAERRDSSLRSSAGCAGCGVLGRADRNRYRRALRPCLATPTPPLAPRTVPPSPPTQRRLDI